MDLRLEVGVVGYRSTVGGYGCRSTVRVVGYRSTVGGYGLWICGWKLKQGIYGWRLLLWVVDLR